MKTHPVLLILVTSLILAKPGSAEELFKTTPLTKPGEFTKGIEGPACDKAGNVYAVNYKEQGTIGRVSPDGKGEVFLTLPDPVCPYANTQTLQPSAAVWLNIRKTVLVL